MRPRLHRRPTTLWSAVAVATALGTAACTGSASITEAGSGADGRGGSPTTTVAVAKDLLAQQADPPGAPGRTLTLMRYTIAPGAKLAPHVHPGIQLAEIVSGTLSYTVESGTVTVHRGSATGPVEQLRGPTETTLGPGDTLAEVGDAVHFGANTTDAPVVILASLLTETGKELAVTVSPDATTGSTGGTTGGGSTGTTTTAGAGR